MPFQAFYQCVFDFIYPDLRLQSLLHFILMIWLWSLQGYIFNEIYALELQKLLSQSISGLYTIYHIQISENTKALHHSIPLKRSCFEYLKLPLLVTLCYMMTNTWIRLSLPFYFLSPLTSLFCLLFLLSRGFYGFRSFTGWIKYVPFPIICPPFVSLLAFT